MSANNAKKKPSFHQRWRNELHLSGLFGGGGSKSARSTTAATVPTPVEPVAESAETESIASADTFSERMELHQQQQYLHHHCRPVPATTTARGRLQPSTSATSGGAPGNYHLGLHGHARRESFLYRAGADEATPLPSFLMREQPQPGQLYPAQRPASRASSVASSSDAPHGDDYIVTPFAQLLSSLRNVRANMASVAMLPPSADDLTGSRSSRPSRRSGGSTMPIWPIGSPPLPESVQQCAQETLDELDWCLDQLESIQVHRSVAEMASSKFRKLLNRELLHFAESSKAGPQISKFLLNTYLDHRAEEELATIDEKRSTVAMLGSEQQQPQPSTSSANASPLLQQPGAASLFNKAKTAAMSRISGVQRLRLSQHGTSQEYGVQCKKEIEVYMQRIREWGVNIFKIQELSKQHALTAVTYTLLRERKLLFKFEIPAGVLVNYCLHLEHHYRNNPYHNQVHGADVAQSINVLISSPALEGVFSDLEVLAAIIAAAIHDVAFKLLQDRDCDFLVGLNKKQRQSFRKMVIEMVLATDMSKHMSLLADLKTMVEAKKISGTETLLDKYQDRIQSKSILGQVLRSAIHLADLSNPTKPIDLYRQWNERILEEYWRQGDREKQLGLEVSPMCDRGNCTVEKSQIGFIDYIVHPLYETWGELVHPDANDILDQLESNRQWYLERMEEQEEDQQVQATIRAEEKDASPPPLPKSTSLLIGTTTGASSSLSPSSSRQSTSRSPSGTPRGGGLAGETSC